MTDWTAFGIRQLPPMSARSRVAGAPPPVQAIVDERAAQLERPFSGVTTDGTVRPGLFRLGSNSNDTAPIAAAASEFLDALDADQRTRAMFAMDAVEWRMWINVHMNHFRHGVMLEDLPPRTRDLALGILRSTLSARGFTQARNVMRINELLAQLSGRPDEFGEWPYFVSIFGRPGGGDPWGWQIDGHHLNVNCAVFDGQIVMTPAFMGSEPCRIDHGPLAGTRMFEDEQGGGLDLIRSLGAEQRATAILRPSILPDDLPPELQNLFDGRMQAGAFHDNLLAPYQGVPGADMSDAQRRLLTTLIGTYVGWTADAHAGVKMSEVASHLDETWFSWFGGTDDTAPFYYRVHSPVVLIEFDHHPGVVFDVDVPTRNHVHTVIRTPNGGDYGTDLLRQHHERYDHAAGRHEPREA